MRYLFAILFLFAAVFCFGQSSAVRYNPVTGELQSSSFYMSADNLSGGTIAVNSVNSAAIIDNSIIGDDLSSNTDFAGASFYSLGGYSNNPGRLRTAWAKLWQLSRDRLDPIGYSDGTNYIVKNAGTAAVNLNYGRDGTENGKTKKSDVSDTYKIYWSGAEWRIATQDAATVYYTNSDTGTDIPETGWVTSAGSSPAPTVETYDSKTMRVAAIGDSVGIRPVNNIARYLNAAYSDVPFDYPHPSVGTSVHTAGLSPAHTTEENLGAVVTHTKSGGTPDYDLFYTGTYYDIGPSATAGLRIKSPFEANGRINADSVKVFYIKESGAGEIELYGSTDTSAATFEYTISTGTDASAVSVAGGVIAATVTAGEWDFVIRASNANVKVIGWDVWNSTEPQVLYYPTATSSLTPDTQFAEWDNAVRDVIMQEWDVDLIGWSFADDISTHSDTSFDVLEDMQDTARRKFALVMFDNSLTDLSNSLRTKCDEQGWYHFSMYDFFGRDETRTLMQSEALGSVHDPAHLAYEVYDVAAAFVLRDLAPWMLFTSFVAPMEYSGDYTVDGNVWTLPIRDGIRFQDRGGNDILKMGIADEPTTFDGTVANAGNPLNWFTVPSSEFTASTSTGGSVSTSGQNWLLDSNATAGGEAIYYFTSTLLGDGSSSESEMDFDQPLGFSIDQYESTQTTNGVVRYLLGKDGGSISVGALAERGFGFEWRNTALYLVAHDGTSLTIEKDLGVTSTATNSPNFRLTCWSLGDGVLYYRVFSGDSLVDVDLSGSETGAPTGDSTHGSPTFSMEVTNGGDAAAMEHRGPKWGIKFFVK